MVCERDSTDFVKDTKKCEGQRGRKAESLQNTRRSRSPSGHLTLWTQELKRKIKIKIV